MQQGMTNSIPDSLATISTDGIALTDAQKAEAAKLLQTVNIEDLLKTVSLPSPDNIGGTGDMSWILGGPKPSRPSQPSDPVGVGSGSKERVDTALSKNSASLDGDLPGVLADATGLKTWNDLAASTAKTVSVGLTSLANPMMGATLGGVLNATEDGDFTGTDAVNVVEDTVLGVTGLGLFTGLAESLAEAAGVYDTQDGIVNSLVDTVQTLASDSLYEPTTRAGWMAAGGILAQIERTAAKESESDRSDRQERTRSIARDVYEGRSGTQSSVGGAQASGSMTGQRDPLGRGEPGGPAAGSGSGSSGNDDKGSDRGNDSGGRQQGGDTAGRADRGSGGRQTED